MLDVMQLEKHGQMKHPLQTIVVVSCKQAHVAPVFYAQWAIHREKETVVVFVSKQTPNRIL